MGPALEFANFPAQKFAMMTSIATWLRSHTQFFVKKRLSLIGDQTRASWVAGLYTYHYTKLLAY